MKLEYENQGTNTYLVYKIEDTDKVDSLSLGMLTNNKIPGMSPAIFTQMDSEKFIKYNVTARISVRQFFTGAVNRKRLLGVFNGIINAMISAEDYMIDTQYIMLDLDYIFVDVTTCDTYLICLPVEGAVETEKDLGMFFKKIMFTIQSDGTENCDHIAKILNYLNGSPVFSISDFKKVLDSINGISPEQPPQVPQAPQAPQGPQVPQPPVNQPVPTPPPVQKPVPNQPRPSQQPPQQFYPQPGQPVQQPQPGKPTPPRPAGNGMGGFAIPQNGGMQPPVQQPPQQAPAGQSDEKKMNLFHLMMHYSKENAELYKKQKEAEKSQSAQAVNAPVAPPPVNNKAAQNMGFAIPGQPTPPVTRPQNAPGMPQPGQVPNGPGMMRPGQVPNGPGMPQPGQVPNGPGMMRPGQAPNGPGMMRPGQVPNAPGMQNGGQPPVYPRPPQQVSNQPGVRSVPNVVSAQPNPVQNAGGAPHGGFGDTVVLGSSNPTETTVLGAGQNAERVRTPYLIRIKNDEKIALNKPVFRIGKEKSYVDYFVSDNTAVSRSHANIVTKDGEYYIVDTNSTNHTFINGRMIQSNVETKLQSGDKIRLANEEFDFQLLG